jgi:hypothetical protein
VTISQRTWVDAPVFGPRATYSPYIGSAFDGTRYLVLWGETYEMHGAIVTNGVVERIPSIANVEGGFFSVAYDGVTFVAAWSQRATPTTYEVRVVRFASDGTMIDAGIAVDTGTVRAGNISSDGNGTSVVTWFNGGTMRAVRIAGGAIVNPTFQLSTDAEPSIEGACSAGNGCLIAWTDLSRNQYDVAAAVISANGTLQPTNLIGLGAWPFINEEIRVVFGGGQYLVTWRAYDGRAPTFSGGLYGARVDTAGALIDLQLIQTGTIGAIGSHDSVWTGTEFLVSYRQLTNCCGPYELRGKRISAQGVVSNPGFFITTGAAYAATPDVLASDGAGESLAAWMTSLESQSYLLGSRIVGETLIDQPPLALSFGGNGQITPHLAFGGGGFLAAWSDYRDPSFRRADGANTRAVRFDLDGAIVAPSFTVGVGEALGVGFANGVYNVLSHCPPYSGFTYNVCSSRYASDGTFLDTANPCSGPECVRSPLTAYDPIDDVFLSAYPDSADPQNFDPPYLVGIYLRGPNGAGIPGSSRTITSTAASSWPEAVVFDGQNFIVAWDENPGAYFGERVRAARIAPDGTPIDPIDGFSLTTTAAVMRQGPRLVRLGGRVLAAWNEVDAGATRVVGAFLENGLPVPPLAFPITATVAGGALGIELLNDEPYATVLYSRGGLYASWVRDDGTALYSEGFQVESYGIRTDYAAAAGTEGKTGIAYSTYVGSSTDADRMIVRVLTFVHGSTCADSLGCGGGDCVDGMCCDEACGGGDPLDCRACSVEAGGEENGTCTYLRDRSRPGCPPPDAGQPDAMPEDAEPIDADPIDADPIDADPIDAEPIDADPIDAEPIDAEPLDAQIDSGLRKDAGMTLDSGTAPPIEEEGCGCTTSQAPRASASLLWLLLAFSFARARGRKRD